jgi:hypothetical protein
MNVQRDGHLCLHVCDLLPEHKGVAVPSLRAGHFSVDAEIAASYANRAGYKISFVRPGQLITLEPPVLFLSPRRLRKDGWPVLRRRVC